AHVAHHIHSRNQGMDSVDITRRQTAQLNHTHSIGAARSNPGYLPSSKNEPSPTSSRCPSIPLPASLLRGRKIPRQIAPLRLRRLGRQQVDKQPVEPLRIQVLLNLYRTQFPLWLVDIGPGEGVSVARTPVKVHVHVADFFLGNQARIDPGCRS